VFDNNRPAGMGTDTLPNLQALFMPMATPNGPVAVLAVQSQDRKLFDSRDAVQLLSTYATQIALALERDRLAEESRRAHVEMETEKLRSSLLAAVSHDLRTPLAVIAGSASSLAERFDALDAPTRRELMQTICDESQRLGRLVENLLQMTRLSAGQLTVDKQWLPIDEVIGSALKRLDNELAGARVRVDVPADLPLSQFDSVLIEQVLMNLLDNAIKYSSHPADIVVRAEKLPSGVAVEVLDRGGGIQPGDENRLFDLFYRGTQAPTDRRGTGLGLSICRAIVLAHGGTIEIANRPDGGARVRFTLPSAAPPPSVTWDALENTGP
jgi:two-component system sensor histidine kinase KdpD